MLISSDLPRWRDSLFVGSSDEVVAHMKWQRGTRETGAVNTKIFKILGRQEAEYGVIWSDDAAAAGLSAMRTDFSQTVGSVCAWRHGYVFFCLPKSMQTATNRGSNETVQTVPGSHTMISSPTRE